MEKKGDYRIVKTEEGDEEVVLLAELSLGQLTQEQENEMVKFVHADIDASLKLIKNQIYTMVVNASRTSATPLNIDNYTALLEQYADLSICKRLGVLHTPIIRKNDGTISGFAKTMVEELT